MSDKLKGLAKGGWHPKGKDGEAESWRKDMKGVDTIAGWMGKGSKKGSTSEESGGHTSTPLSSLKDPASFGPPPRRTTTGLAPPPPPSSSAARTTSTTANLGAPLSREEIETTRQNALARERAAHEAEEEELAKPRGPYKRDTTGLSTAHLPPPPTFKGGKRSPSPEKDVAARPKPPSLPPRLPPRSAQPLIDPPPSYNNIPKANPSAGILNQGAMNRLGASGISVPGFGIGGSTAPPVPSRTATASPPVSPIRTGSAASPVQSGSQLSELQSRFSKMNTTSSPTTNTGGTTWAQKQAALKTASNFRNNPNQVSLSDAKDAATTANNFRERHGEQVASGLKSANSFNQKYGVADRMKSYTGTEAPPASPAGTVAGKKAPPPPPPAKRRDLQGPPPPIPMNSKPTLP